eukprot:jgi/Undpi1/7971/HiC_scaffold_24.g10443.m1
MPSVTAAAHPQLATSFTWGQQQQQQQRQQQQQQRQQQQQHPQQKEREPPPAGADFKPTTQKKNKKPQPKQVPGQPPQQQAPIASPGSHGAAMMAPRKGLKMSPPSSESLTPSVSKLSLTRRNWHNNPEMHLWSAAPAKSKGGPRMTDQGKGGGGGGSMRLPQQSPLRRAEWWRRPPSPLAAHMRPLWDSGSAISSGSGDFPAAMKSMASGEGEAAAGGDTRRGGSQVWFVVHLVPQRGSGNSLDLDPTVGGWVLAKECGHPVTGRTPDNNRRAAIAGYDRLWLGDFGVNLVLTRELVLSRQ